MNDKATDSNDVLVVEPDKADASEEEARSKAFADFMAEAEALKKGDDAAMQDLMVRVARSVAETEYGLAEMPAKKLHEWQADDLIKAIAKAMGHSVVSLRKAWKKRLATEQKVAKAKAAEAAAKAAAAGPGAGAGAGAGGAGAGFSQTFAGAFGQFCLDETGLYWREKKRWSRIAGPFEILGYARDVKSEEWGEVLKFANKDKLVRKEIVTAALLYDDPNAVISWLGSLGMWISGVLSERRALIEYLLLEFEIDKRVTVAHRVGWIETGGQLVFVLPNEIIGAGLDEQVMLAKGVGAPYAQRGTLEDWRDAIAKPAGDHLMARFTISTSLSGPLLRLGGLESGVMHLHGPTTKGKTTLLRVAASAWGSGADHGFVRNWRSTDNALEATLASSNDTLLPLDEIHQVDVRVIGQIIYMIANSTGKARMSREANIKPSHQWRTMVLSSGENSIAILLSEGQGVRRAHAGQLVRAIDIKVDRAQGAFDAFDQSANILDAGAFAEALKRAASTCYGTAGPAFIRLLVDAKIDGSDVRDLVDAFTTEALKNAKGDRGQVARAAQRFGLVAAAGELAIRLGLLPWPKGQLIEDALVLFRAWRDARGGTEPAETKQMIERARHFVEVYGDSRFDLVEPPDPDRKPVNPRAGYRKGEGDDRRWYVLPEVWKSEVCAGFDPIAMAKVLIERDMMEPGAGGKQSQVVRLPKLSPQRFYTLTPSIFEG